MTYPSVAGTPVSATYVTGTSKAVTLPSGITAGELLCVLLGTQGLGGAHTTPSGWEARGGGGFSATGSANDGYCALFVRIADGSETSVTITTVNATGLSIAWRVSGAFADLTGVEAAGADPGNNNAPDPPNLAPAWGALDTLWMVGMVGSGLVAAGSPTNYSSNQIILTGSTPSRTAKIASRDLNAASENPGAFPSIQTTSWGMTIAIEPSASPPAGVLLAAMMQNGLFVGEGF